MLKFYWRRVAPDATIPSPERSTGSVADHNPDLLIRNLLDDPRLQACLAPAPVPSAEPAPVTDLPTRVRGASLSPALLEGAARAAA